MVNPMMVSLMLKKLLSGHDYKPQLTILFINFWIVPSVAFGVGQPFSSTTCLLPWACAWLCH